MVSKTAVIAGIGAVAAGGLGTFLLLKASAIQTRQISITASTTHIPSSGGTVTFNGTTTLANGTTLYGFANGQQVATMTVSSGAFSFTLNFPPNTTKNIKRFHIDVSSNTSNTTPVSNTIVISEDAQSSSASLTLSAVGGIDKVTFSGQDSLSMDTIEFYLSDGTRFGKYNITTKNGQFTITVTTLPPGTYSGVYAKSLITGATSNTVSFTIVSPV